jgi:hypothetical protein
MYRALIYALLFSEPKVGLQITPNIIITAQLSLQHSP